MTRESTAGTAASDVDGDQLRALGYAAKFDRTMSFWQNFSLGFTYLSPVCGVYSMFAYGLAYTCYGFEACGDVAEETTNAGTAIPKAMRMTIYVGAGASVFIALALLLAVPDIPAVIAGRDTDPIIDVLRSAFGPAGSLFVVAVVMVSFVSNLPSIQAAVSRLIYAYARDEMIVGSRLLSRLSPGTHIPAPALILSGIVPAAIVCLGYFMENALATIVSFCTAGIYISFQMIVAAALFSRMRGWKPHGQFTLGRWGQVVNIIALAYGYISSIINIAWPRGEVNDWHRPRMGRSRRFPHGARPRSERSRCAGGAPGYKGADASRAGDPEIG